MKIISNSSCLMHDTGMFHPESKSRFIAVENALREGGFLTKDTFLESSPANVEDLIPCHSKDYVKTVIEEITRLSEGEIQTLSTGDVEISKGSLEAALCAQGSVLRAADAVLQGLTSIVFVNVRPPGHHATHDRGMGFCLFNNAANCALRILSTSSIKRILIIDFDVHHGNGTQDIFYTDPRVFYFSIHQQGIYPGTGLREETGAHEGVGTTMNFPLIPGLPVMNELKKAFENLDRAMEFYKPEFIIISAGFDAHELDPIGGLKFSTETFTWMTEKALSLAERYAKGKLISILEGGYSLRGLHLSILAHLTALSFQKYSC